MGTESVGLGWFVVILGFVGYLAFARTDVESEPT
jgi:hypothetical protein